MKFSTRAIHVGQAADPATGATVVPIYATSTYTQDGIGRHKGFEYSRSGNPTRKALEECIASLEDGAHGLAFASGLAATMAVTSILRPGDEIAAAADLYGGTYRLFERVLKPLNITARYVDGTNTAAFAEAIGPATKLVWIETPSNPLLQLVDIAAVAGITKAKGVPLVVDNTFASPVIQRPLTLGADIVLHSTTKYMGGHSDVVGGAVVTNDKTLFDPIKFYQNAAGGVPGPFDAWLVLRGLKTLDLRVRRHCENAAVIAERLTQHPLASHVNYPGLAAHPQHALARRQMNGLFGGMVTFRVKGGLAETDAFVRRLQLFAYAESLGGVESLCCHPATMTHGSIPKADREARGIMDSTIRLSVGIEDADDLYADIDAALRAVAG